MYIMYCVLQAKVTAVNRKIQQWNKNSNMYGKKVNIHIGFR